MSRPKKAETIEKENVTKKPTSSPIVESKETVSAVAEEIIPKSKKEKTKKQICNVLYKTPTKFAIDFFGDGISYIDKTPDKTNKVEITYSGGSKPFTIISYKFI
jgi:uncharacterized membrane-anchored protein